MSEIDKAGGHHSNGVVLDSLLAWCEPSTRRSWFDEGLTTPIDLSRFTFAFTGNTTDRIPGPLLSRLRVIRLDPIRPEHIEPLVDRVRSRLAIELGLREQDLPQVDGRVVAELKTLARRGSLNLRTLNRIVAVLAPDGLIPTAEKN